MIFFRLKKVPFITHTDRSSLKNLKFHIAEDGCSEVQYDLARQLLEENSGLFNWLFDVVAKTHTLIRWTYFRFWWANQPLVRCSLVDASSWPRTSKCIRNAIRMLSNPARNRRSKRMWGKMVVNSAWSWKWRLIFFIDVGPVLPRYEFGRKSCPKSSTRTFCVSLQRRRIHNSSPIGTENARNLQNSKESQQAHRLRWARTVVVIEFQWSYLSITFPLSSKRCLRFIAHDNGSASGFSCKSLLERKYAIR